MAEMKKIAEEEDDDAEMKSSRNKVAAHAVTP